MTTTYIIYQISEIMEDLGFSKKKAIEHLAELENFGLVEKRRRGLGLPSILYVKSFISSEKNTDNGNRRDKNGTLRSVDIDTSGGVDLGTSRGDETALQEVPGGGHLKNNIKYNEPNGSDIKSYLIQAERGGIRFDGMCESSEDYEELIKANIGYDALIVDHPCDIDTIDGIVRLILETVISTKEYILISGDKRPTTLVKKQMMRLGHEHIEYVLSAMAANTTDVRNIRQYLFASLYNAPNTIDSFYRAKVNHDFPQYAHR